MSNLKYPKGERVWVGYYKAQHELLFIMTSKETSRDYYFLYELVDGSFRKLGKARSPKELKGVDPARIQARRKASGPPTRPYFDAITANKFQWCVGSCPTPAWAEKVFPDKKGGEAMDALWDAIFSV